MSTHDIYRLRHKTNPVVTEFMASSSETGRQKTAPTLVTPLQLPLREKFLPGIVPEDAWEEVTWLRRNAALVRIHSGSNDMVYSLQREDRFPCVDGVVEQVVVPVRAISIVRRSRPPPGAEKISETVRVGHTRILTARRRCTRTAQHAV